MTEPRTRFAEIGQTLRYARGTSPLEVFLEGYLNFYFLTQDPDTPDSKRMQLEAGINAAAAVDGPDGRRRPVVSLRSSPAKAGGDITPWHDEYDLDHGHVRYYGDHKVTTMTPLGTTRGNKVLLDVAHLHGSGSRAERLQAPPLLLFRANPVYVDGARVDKGYIDFCGVAIIERLEHIVQRDPQTGLTFPNIVLDLDVIRLDQDDAVDFRWIDDRRNPELTCEETLRHAPEAWRTWVDRGREALPRVRRRVQSSRVLSRRDQLPEPNTPDAELLERIYRAFDDNKHAFEWLSARVAEHVLGSGYSDGWLTRSGGDGGMDFVGRLNVGNTAAKTPLVVLGQAKCIKPDSSISPDQVARLVARLRRGWVGVFVTTGHYSQQAQVEVVDDEYPVVLVNGRVLTETVRRLAEESYEGDVQRILDAAISEYRSAVTHRRPSEILSSAG